MYVFKFRSLNIYPKLQTKFKPKLTNTRYIYIYMPIKSQLSQCQQMQVHQVKHLSDIAETLRKRSKNTALSKQTVEKQTYIIIKANMIYLGCTQRVQQLPQKPRQFNKQSGAFQNIKGKSNRQYSVIRCGFASNLYGYVLNMNKIFKPQVHQRPTYATLMQHDS